MEAVSVNPSNFLRFELDSRQIYQSTIELLNTTDSSLSYKLKVTNTNAYRIHEPTGELAPRTPVTLRVERTATASQSNDTDKFQILVTDKANPAFQFSKVLGVQASEQGEDNTDLEYSQLRADYERLAQKSKEVTSEVDTLHMSIDRHLKLRKAKQDDVLIKRPSTESFTVKALVLCFILGALIGTFGH